MTATQKKNAHRAAMQKLGIIALVIFIVGGIIGGIIGGAIKASNASAEQTAAEPPALYGTRDGKTINADGVMIVKSSDFVPLDCALSEDIQEYTYYMCQAYYIDFDFVMALMYTESSFRADVVSGTKDYGLMQINARNHEELEDKLGITDFTDAYQNIRAGLYILRGLFEKYDDAARVLMAYNMGDYGASLLWEQGIYYTTYTNKILAKADEYAAQRAEK